MDDLTVFKSKIFHLNFKVHDLPEFSEENNLEICGEIPITYVKPKTQEKKLTNKAYIILKQFSQKYPLIIHNEQIYFFRRMHYFRFHCLKYFNSFELSRKTDDYEKSVEYYQKSLKTRELLINCNVRLISSLFKRRGFLYKNKLSDLFSDGFMNVLVAVDNFDYRKGLRFSTYCTHILLNNSVRNQSPNLEYEQFLNDNNEEYFKATFSKEKMVYNPVEEMENISIAQTDWANILSKLQDDGKLKEIEVLKMSFGIGRDKPCSYDEIATTLSLPKDKIRNIKNRVLRDIRNLIEDGELYTEYISN